MRPALLVVTVIVMCAIATTRTQEAGPGAVPALSALDYFEIRQLYARFAHGLDSAAGSGTLFADVFTADGVYVDPAGMRHQGRDQLASLARLDPQRRKGPTNLEHYTTSILIEERPGGTAAGKGYLMLVSPRSGSDRGGLTGAGQFRDELVRTADGWRISERTFYPTSVRSVAPAVARTNGPTAARPLPRAAAMRLTTEDYSEIEQLYARYAFTWDGVLDDGLRWIELFTPDGSHTNETTTPKQFFFGHQELLGFARAMKIRGGRVPTTVGHFITNIMIDRTPEGAAVKAYRIGVDLNGKWIGPSGIYFDYLVKTADGWRYRRKNFMAANAPVPETATTPNPPAR
jgi:hypothetical protein